MTFNDLHNFLLNEMKMSHIYQPVIIRELLINNGNRHQTQLAKALLINDTSQVDYYTKVLNTHPRDTLVKKRGIASKHEQTYSLIGFEELTDDQIEILTSICNQKVEEFLADRQADPFKHRQVTKGYISGSTRYEVLKRAKQRCELCGVSAKEKALEVDHITPRSKGGIDDICNFQALCYSCNATKGNKDDTDFRAWNEFYGAKADKCLFCSIPDERVVAENELAYVIRDGFPVTEGHTLVIPKRHVADYFDLEQPELNSINQLLASQKRLLESNDPSIEGFNIGMNCGEVAGQTIFHCHVHLIPRRRGDVEEPRGGVRGVIAGKAAY